MLVMMVGTNIVMVGTKSVMVDTNSVMVGTNIVTNIVMVGTNSVIIIINLSIHQATRRISFIHQQLINSVTKHKCLNWKITGHLTGFFNNKFVNNL